MSLNATAPWPGHTKPPPPGFTRICPERPLVRASLTVRSDLMDRVRDAAPAAQLLSKPYQREELAVKVRQLLDRRTAAQAGNA